MSIVVTIKLHKAQKSEFELEVWEDTTVKELAETICSRENCDEDQLEFSNDGTTLSLETSMADLGPDFLADPIISVMILPKIKLESRPSLSTISLSQKFENLSESSETGRFPVGSWVETKIKGSILIDESKNEWCVAKVLEDTGTGYMLEIFENYKYLMPPKIEAADADVRTGRRQSVRFAREKTGDVGSKSIVEEVRGKPKLREIQSAMPLDEKRNFQDGARRSYRNLPSEQKHKASKSDLWGQRKRKSKTGLPTKSNNRRSTWSAGNRKRKSKRNLLEASEEYRAKVREYISKYPDLEPNRVKMYVRVFRSELDKKKEGVITKSELAMWIKANNIEADESTVNQLLSSLEDAEDVNMEKFIDLMCSSNKVIKKDPETRELFKKFDVNGDGVISLDELRDGMKNIFDQDISDDKLKQMMKQADSTGLGAICFIDFRKMMKK